MALAHYLKLNSKVISFISIFLVSGLLLSGCGGGDSDHDSGGSTGVGGSMSRFSVVGDYLYAISGNKLQVFEVAVASLPDEPAVPVSIPAFNVSVAWGIETLHKVGDNLFIGAANGVYIYNVSDPLNPTFISKFLHVRSCDPVVVDGDYAYVTLRTGGRCGFGENRLDVLNISDISNPFLVKSYNMQSPKGLAVGNGNLFVCDDIAGLKIYDTRDPNNLVLSHTDSSVNCYDLIPYQNRLVISDNSGIMQLSYNANTKSLVMVSEIKKSIP